ncbi:hypothetical protein [Shimia sediminis]|uniref:hypothetical protein n=1 Tax=Shimia sediminis TaxID=2497945 RepID=UPI000F8DDD0B|nr:hypothetical protein [Shimia sediminis]
MLSDLDRRLLAAHAAADTPALVSLYAQAAEASDDQTACGFYLTQAYVYALEIGAPQRHVLHERLKALGREE